MIDSLIFLLLGLLILAKGSDFFIDSSTYIARHFGISELIIGLTLVSVGTSLPEFGTSVYAAYYGSGAIAVGNIIGSNIANIGMVLGLTVLLSSIKISREMLKRDSYIMLGVSFLFVALAVGGVSRLDGFILIVGFFFYLRLLYTVQRLVERDVSAPLNDSSEGPKIFKKAIEFIAGCAGVFLGAKLLVESAIDIALAIGVTQSVIGVTLVAFGTSAPELAVCITAIKKKAEDIAIGNVIGSNIFNILWVGGVASLVSPLSVDAALVRFGMPAMIFVAILLLVFMRTNWKLERWEGAALVVLYIGFIFLNF